MTLSKQEEREKRFYKKWEELRLRDNTSYEEIPADIQLKAFLQSEIDLALAERDREVVEKMWQVREDWRNDGQMQALPTADYLISLITNK